MGVTTRNTDSLGLAQNAVAKLGPAEQRSEPYCTHDAAIGDQVKWSIIGSNIDVGSAGHVLEGDAASRFEDRLTVVQHPDQFQRATVQRDMQVSQEDGLFAVGRFDGEAPTTQLQHRQNAGLRIERIECAVEDADVSVGIRRLPSGQSGGEAAKPTTR